MERLSTAAAPALPDAIKQRQRALSPHLEQFRQWSSQIQDPNDVPHFAELAGRPMDLGCWERAVLKQTYGPRRPDRRAFGLMAEGVAYQCRCLHVLGLFTYGPMPSPEELPQFLDQLVDDVAVGMALTDELQWKIDAMISDGHLADAKPVTDFRNKILQCLKDLQARVGAAELEQAQRRVESFVAPESRLGQATHDDRPSAPAFLEEQEPEAHTWVAYGEGKPEPEPEPKPEPPPPVPEVTVPVPDRRVAAVPRLRQLLYVLAALALVYLAVALPRGGERALPRLKLEQFSHVEAVHRITARPPSLYVILHPDRWRELTPAERRELVTEVGRVAEGAGYSGAHLRISGGASVGQWLRKGGVKLWARPAEAT